ncbi:MAG TPA: hypothetical protein VIF57_24325 [Polyangia bacterium]|jgi:hypothetical protein
MRLRHLAPSAFALAAASGGLAALGAGCARVGNATDGGGGTTDRPAIDLGVTPPADAPLLADAFTGADLDPRVGEVYAHSDLTLYRFDPVGGVFVTVGDFSCLEVSEGVAEMLDIAVDRAGNMVGTAAMSEHTVITGRLVSIDKATAACTVLKTGSYPNSLAFVPVGTVLPDREALVGYVNDAYVRIDPDTGTVTGVGNLNAPGAANPWMSSGDIVSIVGGGTYVTIIPKGSVSADPAGDRIAAVDPATGAITRVIGATGAAGLYGLGYWGGIAYGFSSSGALVKIDLTTGAGTPIPISGAPSAGFYGAGTTTIAPIIVD